MTAVNRSMEALDRLEHIAAVTPYVVIGLAFLLVVGRIVCGLIDFRRW